MRFSKRWFAALMTAMVTTTAFSSSTYAQLFNREEYVEYTHDNLDSLRDDWPREVADAPVESIYNGIPENNIEGQFDAAGAIKAFEYVQKYRFPASQKNPTLKAFVWNDALAEYAKKILADKAALGSWYACWGYDNTGTLDPSYLYRFEHLYYMTTGIGTENSIAFIGNNIDEAIQAVAGAGMGSVLAQRDYNANVGAAVLNHNGQKVLLFVTNYEGKDYCLGKTEHYNDIYDLMNKSRVEAKGYKSLCALY